MIQELRSQLAVDLDLSLAFEKGLGGQSPRKQARVILIVGSSNASKLSSTLGEQGYTSCVVIANNLFEYSFEFVKIIEKFGCTVVSMTPLSMSQRCQ
jgi:hypothetical protein